MGEGDKKEWEKKAKEAKEAYDIQYKEWLQSGGAEAIKQVLEPIQKPVNPAPLDITPTHTCKLPVFLCFMKETVVISMYRYWHLPGTIDGLEQSS